MVHTSDTQPTSEQKIELFISYARADTKFVDELVAGLDYDGGFSVAIDRTAIGKGDNWKNRLSELIAWNDTVVFVLTPNSARSRVCRWEMREAERMSKRIIPVLAADLGEIKPPKQISARNYVRFDGNRSFIKALAELREALHTDLEWVREHTRLLRRARVWEERGRHEDLLLNGSDVDVARQWLDNRPQKAQHPPAILVEYIAQCELARTKKENIERQRLEQKALDFEENVRAHSQARKWFWITSALGVGTILLVTAWLNQNAISAKVHWAVNVQPYVLSKSEELALKAKESFRECAQTSETYSIYCPEMVVIPAGTFTMGSSNGRRGERPPHKVSVPRFAVSKFEITFDQWQACVRDGGCLHARDQGWGRGQRPVTNINWNDAQHYAAWLSKLTGKTYRLLSEAEWEYAARAGTTTEYSFGNNTSLLNEHAWHENNSSGRSHEVGLKKPNPWGLYDMHGNVFEWLQDCKHDNYQGAPTDGSAWETQNCTIRMLRGGSWNYSPAYARSAQRHSSRAANQFDDDGIRLARTLVSRN